MKSTPLYNVNDAHNPVSNTVHSVQKAFSLVSRKVSKTFQNTPHFSLFDRLEAQLPEWAYNAFLGLGSLLGLALALVFFVFVLHFLIVHVSSF